MRCQECGHANPENHKFCGMCGAKLQPVAIDDNDPLEIEASQYRDSSRLTSTQRAQIHEIAQRRERDVIARTAVARQRVITGSAVEHLVPEPEEVVDEARHPRSRERATTISGPSFLGLGNEASNSAFVYDDPRDGGYVYDSPSEAPEYLLTEVSRGVSWRAWALFLLLLIAAGLGYIQWRASQHQGPDLAQILSGNGAILDPNHPVVDNNHTKPPAQKGNGSSASSQTDSAKTDDSSKTDDEDSADGNVNASASSTDSSGAKTAPTDSTKADSKAADKANKNDAEGSSTEAAAASSAPRANGKANVSAKDAKDEASDSNDEASAPETKRTKSKPVEEPAPPKSLGEKDPLIIQAEKYIQGRGVRQNCSTGVNLLRQAVGAGNPEASVKLGALYWSGTCVTQSNVTAYQWFARAHTLEPTNRWIERSRNSLWASLSPQEKQRAGGY